MRRSLLRTASLVCFIACLSLSLTNAFGVADRSKLHRPAAPVKRNADPFLRLHPNRMVRFQQTQPNDDTTLEPPSGKRSLVLTVAVSTFSATVIAAKTGLLPDYTDQFILQDFGAAILTAVLGYAFVQVNTWAVDNDYLEPRDSRKLIHTFSAPLFILFWPLFSNIQGARVFAACVPSINAVRLYLASTGGGETSLARAVSRSGDRQEALGGPFIYVCILTSCILAFWRDSPVGIVALSTLAAGDGMADLIGRRLGKNNKWPGLDKSVAGSLAFWVASTLTSIGLLLWMQYWGCLELSYTTMELVLRLTVICFAAAALELLPGTDDNYTVPLSSALLTMLLLPQA
jgi:phytol kinase